ncbi:hypothetical protein D3C72_1278310 [compost metagenome]
MVPGLDGLQERRAERRRERQGEEAGEQDRHHHGQAELLVDDADGAREEGHGHEHGRQHQRDADDRAGNLAHRLAGGLLGRQMLFRHDALDILNDDNRVIHQNADGENHGEHGQNVDRETRDIHDGAGAEQRHGHYQCRNDRVADILQENEHHHEDEDDGLEQRVNDLLDRNLDEGAGVIGNFVFQTRREIPRQLLHRGANALGGLQRIAGGRKLYADSSARLAVQAAREVIAFAAHFHTRDIAQPDG